MKRAIIFYNGDLTDVTRAKRYIKKSDFIICADGGTEYALKLGIKPHVIIGDLDSLDIKTQTNLKGHQIEWIKFKKEKDETDSELAMQFAIQKGFTLIYVFGLLGSRLDHLLTNIFGLAHHEEGIDVVFIEGKQEIRTIRKAISIKGYPGDLVSLLPLKGEVQGITTKNLQYQLTNENLSFGFSRGISNVMLEKSAEVSIKNGQLLVIHTKNYFA